MNRIINFRAFNVFTLEKEFWDYGYHNHNFYELILIENGKGKHRLNDITFNYKKGDIFLLTPSDKHEFIIERKTKFIYIKYTEHFLSDLLLLNKNSQWKEAIKLNLDGKQFIQESIIKNKMDTLHFFSIAKLLLHEFNNNKRYKEEIIADLFSVILTIMIRNLNEISGREEWLSLKGDKIEQILSYIRIYVFDKEKMKITNLAKTFLMSDNYISIFIKKQTGLSIQNHILQYKMKASEKLLKQSEFNINEIAERLGFNDASHFNKIFKKQFGISPKMFRLAFRETI